MIGELIAKYGWVEIVNLLKSVTKAMYREHLLKRHHIVLSIFNLSELLGIDCNLFGEIASIPKPKDFEEASSLLFENFIQIVKIQLQSGGSTLFFKVEKLKATRSAVIVSDLLEARYREIVFILAEIDELIPTMQSVWVNAGRLWRTSYGMKVLKARSQGLLIHINEYKDIRNRILNELGINSETIFTERAHLMKKHFNKYLDLSKELDTFVLGYITSLGIRGKFELPYRSMIDHEGLDDF